MSLALLAALALAGPPADPVAAERAFFADNARAAGVTALPGLQHQVIRSGPAEGDHPARASRIVVRYEGRLPDGRVFNTSPDGGRGVTSFDLQKLIPGWIAALQLMRPGDVWRLFIPSHLAYGAKGKAGVPPGSPLIFQVELVSFETPPPPG